MSERDLDALVARLNLAREDAAGYEIAALRAENRRRVDETERLLHAIAALRARVDTVESHTVDLIAQLDRERVRAEQAEQGEAEAIHIGAEAVKRAEQDKADAERYRTALGDRVAELEAQHGSLRAAARVVRCDPAYLMRLATGAKRHPSAQLLRRMGLRQIVTYERIDRARSQGEGTTE